MTIRIALMTGFLAWATLSVPAHAQGIVGGAQDGAATGSRAAGPVGGAVGAVVGGAVGGVVGGVRGVLGLPQKRLAPRHRVYRRHR